MTILEDIEDVLAEKAERKSKHKGEAELALDKKAKAQQKKMVAASLALATGMAYPTKVGYAVIGGGKLVGKAALKTGEYIGDKIGDVGVSLGKAALSAIKKGNN